MRSIPAAFLTLVVTVLLIGPAVSVKGGGANPAEVGAWSTPFDGEAPAVNMVLLNDGRVLYWSGVEADESDTDPTHAVFFTSHPAPADARVVDFSSGSPVVSTLNDPDGVVATLFCSGQVQMVDGRVVTAGGTDWQTLPSLGTPLYASPDSRVFDPATDTWTRTSDLNAARWYPSVIQGADGAPVAASGIGWLTNPSTMVQTLESFDAASETWTTMSAPDQLLPMYPRITVVPGGPLKGDLFYSTVGTLWGPFGEHPAEATWSIQQSLDADTDTWVMHGPSVFGARQHGSAVMLPLTSDNGYAPQILSFGGTLQRSILATATAELADLSTSPPTNTPAEAMNNPRWHLNSVLLPDGKVLAVGGGMIDNVVVHAQENPPILPAEVFDPATGEWTELASMVVPRMYHSTAVLLADGRVLVGGHVPLPNPFKPFRDPVPGTDVTPNGQVQEKRLEIFSPPYLFRGDRPVIDAAPAAIGYGDTFTVDVSFAGSIDSVMLVRPGSTTHAFDSSQRGVVLDVVAQSGSTLTLQAPPDGHVAPPGDWMLFVNGAHAEGPVPSVAAFTHLA